MSRSRNFTIGLVICAILGAVDVLSILGAGADEGPPAAVLVIGLVLGIITLVGVRLAWAGKGNGVPLVVGSRVVSALTGIPAFFTDDAPDWAPAAVGIGLVLTVIGVAMIYAGRRDTARTA